MGRDISERQYLAIGAVVMAWTDEGIRPDYHREQMKRLRSQWPTLYYAISELVTVRRQDAVREGVSGSLNQRVSEQQPETD